MKKLFVHNPFFRLLTPPVYGLLVYLLILLINNNVAQVATLISNQEVYVSMGLSLIAFESMRFTIVLLNRMGVPEKRRMVLQWPLTTLVAVAAVSIAISQYYSRIIGFDISPRELMLFGAIFLVTALLYNALYLGNRYILHENTQLLEQESKLRENLEAEFSSFRKEINPSLLYDSLEDLILTMHADPELAEELIDSLAAIYRYQLVNRQKEFVTLQEELQAVRHFLRLMEVRYPGQVRWTPAVADSSGMMIMQGALLTTLDTIIRSTLISPRSPLSLHLDVEEDDYLVLTHGLNDRLLIHSESAASFTQLQRSYSIYSDRPFIQVKAGRENYVKFPLLNIHQPSSVSA